MARTRTADEMDDVEVSPSKKNSTVIRRCGEKAMSTSDLDDFRVETDWSSKKWTIVFDCSTSRLDKIERNQVMEWLREPTSFNGSDCLGPGSAEKRRKSKSAYVKRADRGVATWQLPYTQHKLWVKERVRIQDKVMAEIDEFKQHTVKAGETEELRRNEYGEEMARWRPSDHYRFAEQFVKYVIFKMQDNPDDFRTLDDARGAKLTSSQLPASQQNRAVKTPNTRKGRSVPLRLVSFVVRERAELKDEEKGVKVWLPLLCNDEDVPEDNAIDILPDILSFEKLFTKAHAHRANTAPAGFFFWERAEDDRCVIDGSSLAKTVAAMHSEKIGEKKWIIGWATGAEEVGTGWRKL